MTDIQQVEGAAVVSWDNWGDQYSGPSQGVPSMSLQQIFEYGAEPTGVISSPTQAGLDAQVDWHRRNGSTLPLTGDPNYSGSHRVRRGLKGLFR